jgi:type I restriction enzyme M protein
MLTVETKRRLDACRDVLVGKLPLPTDQIELITLALIYKFMDDLDEESVRLGGKRSFFVGPLEKYRWRALLPQTVSADERMNLFAEGIEATGKAEHLPALFRDIFRNSFLKFRDGRILTLFLNELNGFIYSHSEELGNAFEYLLKTMGIQAENGQFRTPRHIINFMVACLDPQPNDRILDPACGTGGFLVSCYKHILAQHTSAGSKIPGDKLTHDQRQKVYSNLTGYDVTDLMVKLSKVNLFLHGFPDPAIHIYDTLTNDARWNEKADLILANPPFMTPKGGVSPHSKFRVAAKRSEVLFTDYIAEHLTPDGRAGFIVPKGVVATTQNAYVKLRRFLVEDSLVAVVSLPAGVFKPYSGIKTSILFLDKRLAREIDDLLFVNVAADGFELGDKRNPIDANDLPEAQRLIRGWLSKSLQSPKTKTTASIAFGWAKRSVILARSDCSVCAERILGVAVGTHSEWPMVKLGEVSTVDWGNTNLTKSSYATDGQYLAVSAAGPDGKIGHFEHEPLVTVISAIGAQCGKVFFPQERFTAIKNTITVTADRQRLRPHFLFAMLSLNRLPKRGAGQPFIAKGDVVDYEIPLPPMDEQDRIMARIEIFQDDIARLQGEITNRRAQIECVLDEVWGNGAE